MDLGERKEREKKKEKDDILRWVGDEATCWEGDR